MDAPFHRDAVTWPDGWSRVEGTAHAAELYRELHTTHPLYGRRVTALAQCCDDVLFLLEGDAPRCVVVHLTWRAEAGRDFPAWTVYDQLADWLRAVADGATW